jgi:hypothetical protein
MFLISPHVLLRFIFSCCFFSNENLATKSWRYGHFMSCFSAIKFFFSVPVCAITASGVPGGTFVSMDRFNTLCG